ncbi:hypothetical protein [Musicola keenii]|uniref:hypothetical protein n=1 Tax=Musicola keenii TaxID=2884250 RepID=UPI001FA9981B
MVMMNDHALGRLPVAVVMVMPIISMRVTRFMVVRVGMVMMMGVSMDMLMMMGMFVVMVVIMRVFIALDFAFAFTATACGTH